MNTSKNGFFIPSDFVSNNSKSVSPKKVSDAVGQKHSACIRAKSM